MGVGCGVPKGGNAMTSHERALRDAGAVPVKCRRHKVYLLNGQRVTLHRGTRTNLQEAKMVRRILNRLGRA